MKTKLPHERIGDLVLWIALGLPLLAVMAPGHLSAGGTWTKLRDPAPGGDSVGLMLLLPDGSVMAADKSTGNGWFKLAPDNHGHYVNGTWTTRQSMNSSRLFYSSAVLRDGRVFVAGAEYGTGGGTAEVYDPPGNSWTPIAVPAGLIDLTPSPPPQVGNAGFRDSGCKILPDGTVLIAPVYPVAFNGTVLFDPTANWLSAGPAYRRDQSEAGWVKLPDGSILTVDADSIRSERYIPSLSIWVDDADLADTHGNPIDLYDGAAEEIGPGMLLPDGRALFIGATGKTALYTPTGDTNMGTWAAGPIVPGGLVTADAPAAMLVNGKVLCAVGPAPFMTGNGTIVIAPPTSFYEYDYSAGTIGAFNQVSAPGGAADQTDGVGMFATAMLCLPDGTVLYSHSGPDLYVYQPDGSPMPSAKPVISSLGLNAGGSYHLLGTGFNGICEGAAYGDDAQMDSNYPLTRITDAGGNVTYLRTYNWSSTGVRTGNQLVSTEFVLPTSISQSTGPYSLQVVANGIASDPVMFDGPLWVDFSYPGPYFFGTYPFPYDTMATATLIVAAGGTIFIKSSVSHERMRISKAMSLVAVGGNVTIGR